MKVFIVLSCIALAAAKPQGYSYNQPGGSFSHSGSGSLLQGQSSSLSAGLNLPSTASAPVFNGGASFASSGSSHSFGSSPSFSGQSFASAPSSSFSGSFGSAPSASFGSGSFGSAPSASFGSGSFGSAPSASFNSFGSGSFGPSNGAEQAIVQKHIYVHVPPPDHEELIEETIPIAPAQKQKHYKIIFIKAPSAPSFNAQALLQRQQVQNEEKTLVYVLVKKPESLSEIQELVPSAPPTPPSKPEVYFIKYKAQKEHGSSGPISSGPISSGHLDQPTIQALSSHSSGSVIQSLPAPVEKPAPVYGPAH